jgi:hypothetical protein
MGLLPERHRGHHSDHHRIDDFVVIIGPSAKSGT